MLKNVFLSFAITEIDELCTLKGTSHTIYSFITVVFTTRAQSLWIV